MNAAPTRVRSPPPEPAASPPPSGRSWTSLVLATVCGALLGVLGMAALQEATVRTRTETQRVTVPEPVTTGGTVIVKTLVPTLVGEPLDVARQRTERARFSLTVDSGDGFLGVLRDANWEVVAQRPGPGELIEQGSTVHVDIVRR